MKRSLLLVALTAQLGACARPLDWAGTARLAPAPELSAPVTAAPATLISLPPQAGAVAAVETRAFANGFRERVRLRTPPGEGSRGRIEIDVGRTPAAASTGDLPLYRPTSESIRDEILARFPKMRMRIVERPLHDRLGRIGLAIGRNESGLRCAFGWQWIDDLRDPDGMEPIFPKPADAKARSPRSAFIRVSLCRRDSTVDQLAAWIEGLGPGDPGAIAAALQIRAAAPAAVSSSPTGSLEAALGPAPSPKFAGPRKAFRAARKPDKGPARSLSDSRRTGERPKHDGPRYLGSDPAPIEGPAQRKSNRAPVLALPPQALEGPAQSAKAEPTGAGHGSLARRQGLDSPDP